MKFIIFFGALCVYCLSPVLAGAYSNRISDPTCSKPGNEVTACVPIYNCPSFKNMADKVGMDTKGLARDDEITAGEFRTIVRKLESAICGEFEPERGPSRMKVCCPLDQMGLSFE